jgi:hypothetical protein
VSSGMDTEFVRNENDGSPRFLVPKPGAHTKRNTICYVVMENGSLNLVYVEHLSKCRPEFWQFIYECKIS